MPCRGCAQRKQALLAVAGRALHAVGARVPVMSWRAMARVRCGCGHEAPGRALVVDYRGRVACPKCGGHALVPAPARRSR